MYHQSPDCKSVRLVINLIMDKIIDLLINIILYIFKISSSWFSDETYKDK